MNSTRTLASAIAMGLALAGASAMASERPAPSQVTSQPLTRAEVLADLAIYRQSGLAAEELSENADYDSPQHQAAQARYAALRGVPQTTVQSLSRAEVLADLAIYRQSGLAAAELPETSSYDSEWHMQAQARYAALRNLQQVMRPPLSRAEVLADLTLYRESGLAAAELPESSSRDSGWHTEAQTRYAALRNSERYTALVQKFSGYAQASMVASH